MVPFIGFQNRLWAILWFRGQPSPPPDHPIRVPCGWSGGGEGRLGNETNNKASAILGRTMTAKCPANFPSNPPITRGEERGTSDRDTKCGTVRAALTTTEKPKRPKYENFTQPKTARRCLYTKGRAGIDPTAHLRQAVLGR